MLHAACMQLHSMQHEVLIKKILFFEVHSVKLRSPTSVGALRWWQGCIGPHSFPRPTHAEQTLQVIKVFPSRTVYIAEALVRRQLTSFSFFLGPS